MVAESSEKFWDLNEESLSADNFNDVQAWVRPIHQALTLEADRGFQNLQGRKEHFNVFLERTLANPPQVPLPLNIQARLKELSHSYITYPNCSDNRRRRLVANSRQLLHQLSKNFDLKSPAKPLTLRRSSQDESRLLDGPFLKDSLTLRSPLTVVKGIGPKLSQRLAGLGILIISDLLKYYPRDYVDYSSLRHINDLEIGEAATIIAKVRRCNGYVSPKNNNLSILELFVQDSTGRLKVTRFFAGRRFTNSGYIQSQVRLYPPGTTVAISGLVRGGPYGKGFQDPLIEVMETSNSILRSRYIGRLVPIYALTEGVSAERFRDLVASILPLSKYWPEPLPKSRLQELSLLTKDKAIFSIHRPDNADQLRSARKRLVFDEFLLLQLGLLRRRAQLRKCSAPPLDISFQEEGLVSCFLKALPFSLTKAQLRVLADIDSDLMRSEPMARLLQGDVGSGKTIVAIIALLKAVQSGCQGAFMAPTEVLAEQHFRTLCAWLPQLHITVDLLTGSTKRSKRRQILDDLSNGSLKILVGTHALIEDPVSFHRLGLVVVDEQHRFGVHQRNRLLSKGIQPHLLTMTATPIPRTLALSLHGDLDVSQIDELPPGRTPITTSLLSGFEREKAYQLIRDQVSRGQYAYFVLPLVEESAKLDLRSAKEVYTQLSQEIFPEFEVGLLHGRMSGQEKQSVISNFGSASCQILVSTTVIEVGLDVSEATVMVIDHADRFGLAQLHQLRGRVGRGGKKSYCLLINDSKNALARERLEVLVRSHDGFEISEIDLRFRGPGQVLGTRQSGLPDLALASLADDTDILELAREEAKRFLKNDPELISHGVLRKMLEDQQKRLIGTLHLN